jgi:hypothetical protein
LIQRLQDTSIHGGNHIHRRVQFFLGHSLLPCIRKAPFDSRVAEPHHRHGKTHEHLLAFGETLDGMGVTIESAKISLLQFRILSSHPSLKKHALSAVEARAMGDLLASKPETRHPKPYY